MFHPVPDRIRAQQNLRKALEYYVNAGEPSRLHKELDKLIELVVNYEFELQKQQNGLSTLEDAKKDIDTDFIKPYLEIYRKLKADREARASRRDVKRKKFKHGAAKFVTKVAKHILPSSVDYFLFNEHRKQKKIRTERRLRRAAEMLPLPETVKDVEQLHSGSKPDSDSDDDKAIISMLNSAKTKTKT